MNEQQIIARQIIARLEACKNDLDELSNGANDFHVACKYANAAVAVHDIINYLKR